MLLTTGRELVISGNTHSLNYAENNETHKHIWLTMLLETFQEHITIVSTSCKNKLHKQNHNKG